MIPYKIERYTSSDWPRIAALLGKWPFKPLAGHAQWPAERLQALCLARAADTLQSTRAVVWIARLRNIIQGFASLSSLPWDSEHLGLPAARLDFLVADGTYAEQYEAKQALLTAVLQHSVGTGIQHLTARINSSDLSSLHVLEQANFIMVDGILTSALHLDAVSLAGVNGHIDLGLATPGDSEAVGELARNAYIYDRFHSDPAIRADRADELHAAWVRNACANTAADAVVLAKGDQGLLGFVTCKLQPDTKVHLDKLIGTIVLVATAQQARRRGVARAITLGAVKWFSEQGVDIVEVGTQLRNIPASRLYENCGFRLVDSSVSLRRVFLEKMNAK